MSKINLGIGQKAVSGGVLFAVTVLDNVHNIIHDLIPAVLFFALGFLARAVKTDLRLPPDMAKMLSIYLLVAIGLHGGYELGKADLGTAVNSVIWAVILGFSLPVIGYLLLIMTRKVDTMNAAAIAAHYGSVSAGTFLTAIAYLDNLGISYESYPLIITTPVVIG